MENRTLSQADLRAFAQFLRREERSAGTIEKYLRDVRRFLAFAGERPVTRELAAAWKAALLSERYAPCTINSMLSALNALFGFLGWTECRVRFLKVQRRVFRDPGRELSRTEYARLIAAAQHRRQVRLELLIETICATGIRVSEVRYITLESIQRGMAEIAMKGKVRIVLIPAKLCRKLQKYARKQKIVSGEIFLTRNGNSLSRRQIWAEMKELCKHAGVEASKVFPHNLRHLFATTYYRAYKDIARLADVLGHSSMETTRIYLISSGREHQDQLERLGLVS